MDEIKVEALYTLSGINGVDISKGKHYIVRKIDFQTYEILGNLNNKVTLSQEELEYRFKRL